MKQHWPLCQSQVPGANQAQENNGGEVASQYQGLGFKLLLLHTSHGQANLVYKLWQYILDKILSCKDLYVLQQSVWQAWGVRERYVFVN